MISISVLRAVLMAVFLANAVTVVISIPSRELDTMLDALRLRGYDLFCNAIVTSDLRIDLLSQNETHSFTFFAPTDASLFALDMTQTASSYTDTLRAHIIPRRLSRAELRLLPDGYMLPTLLSAHRLLVTRHPGSSVTHVGGVDVAFTGLFYGRHIAVHGLAGILSIRSDNPLPPPMIPVRPPPPVRSPDHRFFSFSPRSGPGLPEKNHSVLGNVPNSVSFNVTDRRRRSHPPVEVPAPEPVPAQENVKSGSPEAEPPANLINAPSVTPAISPSRYPDSEISMPPEGYSDAEAPAPVGLEMRLRKKVRGRVSLMETETETEGVIQMPEDSNPLDGVIKCNNRAVGLKDHMSDDNVGHMQCYAA